MSTSSDVVLSIIIVTWNGKRYAMECLDSLRAHPASVPTEVIVVDNASTDGTPDAIRSHFPEVKLIENAGNFGFARANNIGMAASKGKYVALVNSDVVIPTGCLDSVVAFMESHPDVGMIGPKMLSPDGGIGDSVMRLPTVWNTLCCALGLHSVFPKSKLLGGFAMEAYPYNKTEDVEMLTGWFWVVQRTALDRVGGLDEQFFMYGEDIDWCHRFRADGWRVVFYAEAEALHYGAASSAEAPTRFYVEMRRANMQYFRKHHGTLGVLGYRAAMVVHELTRIAGHSILYCYSPTRRASSAAKIRNAIGSLRWLGGDNSVLSPQAKVATASRQM